MRYVGLVVNGHVVDMNGPLQVSRLARIQTKDSVVIAYPDSMPLATRRPLPKSSVNTAAARP